MYAALRCDGRIQATWVARDRNHDATTVFGTIAVSRFGEIRYNHQEGGKSDYGFTLHVGKPVCKHRSIKIKEQTTYRTLSEQMMDGRANTLIHPILEVGEIADCQQSVKRIQGQGFG